MLPAKLSLISGVFVALGLACQPSPGTPEDSDTGSSTGSESGTSGVTGGEETGGVNDMPILERPPVVSHDCEATQPVKQIAGSDWRTEALAVLGDDVWQVRSGTDALALSTITADGALGTSIELDGEDYAYKNADVVAADGRLGVVWVHTTPNGDASLRFAVVSADGAAEVPAHDLDGISNPSLQFPLVLPRAAGGWSIFYGTADGSGKGSYHLVHLDAGGDPVGAPVEVLTSAQNYGFFAANVVATADGYAMTYIDSQAQGNEVLFVALDAQGTQLSPPNRISRAAEAGWYVGPGTLLAVGDGVWATWTEIREEGDVANPTGYQIIRVGVLDAAGEGTSHLLSAPIEGKTASSPTLFEFGDRIGLAWTTGTIIFICGGCIADDDLNVVLLDPTAVAPASAVVTHPHENNGLVRPEAAVVGDSILLTADVDYHALTSPAVGATACPPSP